VETLSLSPYFFGSRTLFGDSALLEIVPLKTDTDLSIRMQVHMGTLFICACLPTYRPLFVAALKWVATTIGSGSTTRAPYESQPVATTHMPPSPTSGPEKAKREYDWVEENNHSDIALVKLKDEGRLVRTARL
jgi:hypothetical protein